MSRDRIARGYETRWDITAAKGSQGELYVADIIAALKADDVEIKYDDKFGRRGNLFIEIECMSHRSGAYEPSGLTTTKATLFAIVLGDSRGTIVVETAVLRELVNRAIEGGASVVDGAINGDHPTRGALIRAAWLVQELQRRASDTPHPL